ncbi:MAG: vancomycin resistance protein, partial [bacterium]|nr:vancomycin resistance protein [bacterium]
DATVYPPSPDFRFKNDTPAHILVQVFFNKAAQSLMFELYGTNDGRQTVLGKPVVYNITAPPAPKYQDDPSLMKGVEKQTDWGHPGADVYFLRTVVRKKEILIDEKIQSHYIPWAAVFLRGTKE